MSADGSVTLAWGDGEHKFRLPIGGLRELQQKCDAGAIEVMDRLRDRRWRVDDVRETLRLGLIGGGMTPVDALILVKRYVDDRPIMESVPTAFAVLMAALIGVPDDPVGKAEAEEPAPAGSSPSPLSSELPAQSE